MKFKHFLFSLIIMFTFSVIHAQEPRELGSNETEQVEQMKSAVDLGVIEIAPNTTSKFVLTIQEGAPVLLANAVSQPTLDVLYPDDPMQKLARDSVSQIDVIVDHVLQVLTNNPDAQFNNPGAFNPGDLDSLMEWWGFWLGLLLVPLTTLYNKFFPSARKAELVIKSTILALFVIGMVIAFKGVSAAVILNAIIAFIMRVMSYEGGLKYLGLKSPRQANYTK